MEEDFHLSIHEVLRLEGALDLRAFERAWTKVVRRQESLRTVFIPTEGDALQVVLPKMQFHLPVISLEGRGEELETETALAEELLQSALGRPFDLRRGPLARLLLLRLGPERHLLLLDFHHIVFDGWSVAVLHRELEQLYQDELAVGEARRSSLPKLKASYGEFSKWQRERLQGEKLDRLLSYWRSRLEGLEPVLEVPADRPRPAQESRTGGLAAFQWPEELAAAVEARCRAVGATPFSFYLTAFQTLLSRLSGRRDVAVGIPVAGRPRADLENLVGFFINSLILRTRIAGNPAFETLRQQVGLESVEALDHSELPFERLVEEMRPPRDLGAAPIYQISFQLQTTETEAPALAGLRVSQEERDPGTAALDLSFYLEPREGALRGFVQYSRDLFDPSTALRMAQWLRTLVEGAVASPETRVHDLPLLSQREVQQLQEQGRGKPVSSPKEIEPRSEESLLAGILRQVEAQPEAVAVSCQGESLSYGELWNRGLALAEVLMSEGAGPEQAVGVCLQRSVMQVQALLGVLLSGAAYLPLDPAHPEGRLRAMLKDCGARLLVGDEVPGSEALRVEIPGPARDQDRGQDLGAGLLPLIHLESTAFLLFTSGSSGRPKAVALPHGEWAHHCRVASEAFALSPKDVVLQFASAGFDTALEQTLTTLWSGARLVMRGADVWTAEELFAVIGKEGVTVANLTTSYWQQVTSEWKESRLDLEKTSLRLMIVGGEQMGVEGVRDWDFLTADGRPHLLNAYGPTETTVTATLSSPEVSRATTRLPVGSPLAGRTVAIIDERGWWVPMGVPGELMLSGRGLARGYLERPRETAENFLPSTQSRAPGARMYATGDLARWREDGQLEIVGRRDRQVKLRGFRIELGEVEAALEGLAEVRQAVALVQPMNRGDGLLVAFVVPASGVEDEPWEVGLKGQLETLLPPFLVPARIQVLESLPLTTNGKVDLQALSALAPSSGAMTEEASPWTGLDLSSPAAGKAAEAWRVILGVEEAASEQHFFELGGHSLLATRLVSRINRELGLKLTVRSVFEAPRLGQWAQCVEAAAGQSTVGPGLQALPRKGQDLPLSYSQERMWFLDRLTPGSSLYSIAGQIRLAGTPDAAALEKSLNALIERHESLRTVFEEVDGRPVQKIQEPRIVALPTVDLSGLNRESRQRESRRVGDSLSQGSFDLATGPLVRFCLVRQEGRLHRLVVVLHHIVSDGWSQGVFFRELSELYSACRSGSAPQLPVLEFQYADYAGWQRETLVGEQLETLLSFWRGALAAPHPVLELPADRPRPPVPSFRGEFQPIDLGANLSAALERVGRRAETTTFMVLLAGLQSLLWRLTGQRDVLIGTPVANRGLPELEGIIGFFVNTLVLRTEIPAHGSFLDLLALARETTLDASKHQEAPFERLVAELIPDRDLSHTPFFQVMLAHQDASVGKLSMSGLDATVEPLGSETSKFDLTVYLRETSEGLQGVLEFSTDLFDRTTMARLGRSLGRVLASIAESPSCSLASLPLLSAQERWQVLGEWNDPKSPYGPPRGLHELVEEQVDRTPEGLAVVLADKPDGSEGSISLTYRELDLEANRLARYLRDCGVGPDDLVGVVLERSLELVVALLGVLKVGAAYVPMDPQAPPSRLAMMIEDTGAAAVLTGQGAWKGGGSSRGVTGHESDLRRPGTLRNPGAKRGTAGLSGLSRRTGLRDLHLRLYWQAQGSDESPSGHLQSPEVDARGLRSRCGGPGPPEDSLHL